MRNHTLFAGEGLLIRLVMGALCLAAMAAPTFAQNADLEIQLFSNVTEPLAGEQFTYNILVTNLGPDTADDVIIHDTLVASNFVNPNGCSLSVRTEGGLIDEFNCNFALNTGVFELAEMGSNFLNPRGQLCVDQNVCERDDGRIIITINMTAEEGMTLSSTADVFSLTNDPDMSNNTAIQVNEWTSVADLGLTMTSVAPQINAGEWVEWSLEVENFGPSAAQNVSLEDVIPEGLVTGSVTVAGNIVENISSIPVVQGAVSCSLGTIGDPSDPAVCDLGGLPVGWGAQLTLRGRVSPGFIASQGLQAPLGIVNSALVTSETLDVNLDDNDNCSPAISPCPPAPDAPNFAGVGVEVWDSADLALSQFAVGSVEAGGSFHYEFQIQNAGPSVARDASLRSFLPEGIQFEEAVIDFEGAAGFQPLSCTVADGSNALFCPIGDVPITGAVPIIVFVDVTVDTSIPDGTMLTHDGDLFLSDTPDPDALNNSAATTITVNNPLDIDYFSEVFPAGTLDLAGRQIELRPAANDDMYTACVRNTNAPAAMSGTTLTLGDDDSVAVDLLNGKKVRLYGQKYSRIYVSSNGFVTLGEPDSAYLPSAAAHFSTKRISAFFADMDPRLAGEIWWTQTTDRVVIAWDGVPGYKLAMPNTVYLELFFNGDIFIKFSAVDTLQAAVGLSRGLGVPDPFYASDFEGGGEYPECSTVTDLLFGDGFIEF